MIVMFNHGCQPGNAVQIWDFWNPGNISSIENGKIMHYLVFDSKKRQKVRAIAGLDFETTYTDSMMG